MAVDLGVAGRRRSGWFLGSAGRSMCSRLLTFIAIDRAEASLAFQTLGVVVALTFSTLCTATQWSPMSEWIACGEWNKFQDAWAFCFQFGLANLVTTITSLLAMGYVSKKGEGEGVMSRAWIRYLPFAFLTTVVHVAIFVYLHILLSRMLELHQHCQKVAYLSALNSTSELANAFIADPAQLLAAAEDAYASDGYDSFGHYAWFAYMVPVSVFQLAGAAVANSAVPLPWDPARSAPAGNKVAASEA